MYKIYIRHQAVKIYINILNHDRVVRRFWICAQAERSL